MTNDAVISGPIHVVMVCVCGCVATDHLTVYSTDPIGEPRFVIKCKVCIEECGWANQDLVTLFIIRGFLS
jgi:hypothetical protein